MKFMDIDELEGPTNFIKLKDGESVAGVCRGEIETGYVVWQNRVKSPATKDTPGAKFNFKVMFVVKEGTSFVSKVLEGGMQIYKQLAALDKQWDLETSVVFVSREGSGPNDTEYTVTPAPPKQQLSKEELEYIATIEPTELKEEPKEVKNFAPGAKGKRY